jgi:acetyltransferase-like isoleucine patch superfamily enzyme
MHFYTSRDAFPSQLAGRIGACRVQWDTLLATLLARWWGVELVGACTFYGVPLFRRCPGSSIRIGTQCEFRSKTWSNPVGVNRVCAITTLNPAATVRVGSHCGFSGAILAAATSITLGDRVMCGANVTITDTDWHALDPRDRAFGAPPESEPVVIGDDVWLGLNVVVLKGITIGAGTVVGAGSIVSRSLPAGVVAAGQPAHVIRTLAGSFARDRTGRL